MFCLNKLIKWNWSFSYEISLIRKNLTCSTDSQSMDDPESMDEAVYGWSIVTTSLYIKETWVRWKGDETCKRDS